MQRSLIYSGVSIAQHWCTGPFREPTSKAHEEDGSDLFVEQCSYFWKSIIADIALVKHWSRAIFSGVAGGVDFSR